MQYTHCFNTTASWRDSMCFDTAADPGPWKALEAETNAVLGL